MPASIRSVDGRRKIMLARSCGICRSGQVNWPMGRSFSGRVSPEFLGGAAAAAGYATRRLIGDNLTYAADEAASLPTPNPRLWFRFNVTICGCKWLQARSATTHQHRHLALASCTETLGGEALAPPIHTRHGDHNQANQRPRGTARVNVFPAHSQNLGLWWLAIYGCDTTPEFVRAPRSICEICRLH